MPMSLGPSRAVRAEAVVAVRAEAVVAVKAGAAACGEGWGRRRALRRKYRASSDSRLSDVAIVSGGWRPGPVSPTWIGRGRAVSTRGAPALPDAAASGAGAAQVLEVKAPRPWHRLRFALGRT